MGSLKEGKIVNEEKTKIPVFAVLKNGAILKNIFVINRPPSPSLESATPVADDEKPDVLIVGRHPDCNIVLMHPSISRFHLQISANPSSQKLYVTDLTSVHGTWVSEKKIEPGIAIELNEGDTLRVGGSTRLYRLHWVPLSCAFEKENPFLSEMDVAMVEEKEDENEEKETEMAQDDNFFATQLELVGETVPLVMQEKEKEESSQVIPAVAEKNGEEIQSSDSFPGGILPLLFNENSGFLGSEEIISALFTPETAYFSPCDRKEEIKAQYKNANEVMENSVVLGEVSSEAKNDHFNEQTNTPEYHPPEETRCKKENTCMETEKEYKDLMNLDSSLSLFTTEVAELSETEKRMKKRILSCLRRSTIW
ncbi:hypothetical protein K2173_011509 [Erythroxylum novogranatense]|uniref:FHA domain-containing protein n=1 Tax=Erythroxylum novogranatense TaxID=1862640 RepID=A0AAV8TW67_9ROSI|nr:hypothetical protein K2173_011509 [Erythroxylum novogranatense]